MREIIASAIPNHIWEPVVRVRVRVRVKQVLWCTENKYFEVKKMAISMYFVLDREFVLKRNSGVSFTVSQDLSSHVRSDIQNPEEPA